MTRLITPSADYTLNNIDTHVWILDASTLDTQALEQQLPLLSHDERTKKMASPIRQRMFIATRVLLRMALARYCDHSPQELLFSTLSSGKPVLTNASLQFNLSHCDSHAALAVSRIAELGIDLEIIRPRSNLMTISERFFHADEVAQLSALTDDARLDYFFKLWTLKEAFYKGLGSGIATGLDKTIFSIAANQINVKRANNTDLPIDKWQFYQAQLPGNLCLALAAKQLHDVKPVFFDAEAFFSTNPVSSG